MTSIKLNPLDAVFTRRSIGSESKPILAKPDFTQPPHIPAQGCTLCSPNCTTTLCSSFSTRGRNLHRILWFDTLTKKGGVSLILYNEESAQALVSKLLHKPKLGETWHELNPRGTGWFEVVRAAPVAPAPDEEDEEAESGRQPNKPGWKSRGRAKGRR